MSVAMVESCTLWVLDPNFDSSVLDSVRCSKECVEVPNTVRQRKHDSQSEVCPSTSLTPLPLLMKALQRFVSFVEMVSQI